MKRRPGISARANDPTSWAARRMRVSPVTWTVPTDTTGQRFHHPAITAPARKCFRVIRMVRHRGEIQIEDIGAFPTATSALQLLARERGHAVLLEPSGKPSAQNGQPIEERVDHHE